MIRPGDLLRDRYRIEAFLGRGGMADVYLAMDTRRQVYVAIKVLREDLAEDPEFVRRFRREAEALARLDHPFIVRFYSFERQSGIAFIVMDYVEGETLRKHLLEADGPLPGDEVTRILHQVGSALQYAHNEGYIHRDIKPGNILIRKDGTALLSDFGIARAAETATMTLGPIGAPAYMSPEQIRGEEVTSQTDIYSLGIVLYEMVTGRRPFTGDGATGTGSISRMRWIQQQQLHETPPDPRRFNPNLPEKAAWIIEKSLAKTPHERWPDVMSMIQAWEKVMGVKHQQFVTGRIISRSRPATAPDEFPGAKAMEKKPRYGVFAIMASVIFVLLAVFFLAQKTLFSQPEPFPTPTPAPLVADEKIQQPEATPPPDIKGTAEALAASYAESTAAAQAAIQTEVARRTEATAENIERTATANAEMTATTAAFKATATQNALREQETTLAQATATARVKATVTQQAKLTLQARSTPMAQVAKSSAVNVRSGPGTVYPRVAKLNPNARVAIVGVNGNWWQIKLSNGKKGWVRKDMVKTSNAVDSVPLAKAPPTPKASAQPSVPAIGALASNRTDFSGQQGVKGWEYQMEEGRGTGVFTDMPIFDGTCWHTGTWEQTAVICKNGEVHPGVSTRIAYRWHNSVNRQVSIKVHAHKIDTSCGDGVKVETYQITEGYAPGLLGQFVIAAGDNKGKTAAYKTNLTTKESVFVVVDIGDAGNVACDRTRIYIDIY